MWMTEMACLRDIREASWVEGRAPVNDDLKLRQPFLGGQLVGCVRCPETVAPSFSAVVWVAWHGLARFGSCENYRWWKIDQTCVLC